MSHEKSRNARIRAQLDRLKAQYVREDAALRALFDAAGVDAPPPIDPRLLRPSCPPAPVAALRG